MDLQLIALLIWLSFFGTGITGIIALLSNRTLVHRLSTGLLCLSTLIGALASLMFILSGEVSLNLGSIGLFFGNSLELDFLSALFYFIVNLISCIVGVFALSYLPLYAKTYNVRVTDALTAFFIFGMQLVLISSTPISFLAGWEIMSLSSFFLVFADRQPESIKAALFYLIMTHLGAGAILASFMILSGGSLLASFNDMTTISSGLSVGAIGLSFGLALFGFGSKAGLWPFHVWLPEAHPQAPSHISALMSGVMLKLALYGFLRLALFVLAPIPASWCLIIILLGLMSAIYGVLYAVVERDLKRLLAYSSMENLGLIFTMVGVAMLAKAINQPALFVIAIAAAIFHSLAHAIFKSGLFMGAGVIISQIHDRSLEKMGGLANRMPKFSGAMLILIIAAAALPPLSGFVGEWLFLQELVSTINQVTPFQQGVLILVLAAFSFVGGLSVFAMIKMFAMIFLAEPRSSHASHATEPKVGLAGPIAIMAGLSVLSGLLAPMILQAIQFGALTTGNGLRAGLSLTNGQYFPGLIAGLLFATVALAYFFRQLLSNPNFERYYHTWDCGQPITAQMEYTATAFSAPIRFFFRMMLRTTKIVTATPIIATNKWMATREFSLEIRRIWVELIYQPISRGVLYLSTQIRRLQNGVIQFYIALILLALVVTIALTI